MHIVAWIDLSSLEQHEQNALLRFLWQLHHKSGFIKSLALQTLASFEVCEQGKAEGGN